MKIIFGLLITSLILWFFIQALVNSGVRLLNAWEGKHISQKTAYIIGISLVIVFWLFIYWGTGGDVF